MMKNIIGLLFVLLLMLAVYYGGQWLQNNDQLPQTITVERIVAASCDPFEKPCKIKVQQQQAVLSFQQTPSALEPFTAVVETDIPGIEQVGLRFYMREMDMGFNTFEMKETTPGRWEKDVILPVCSSGSTSWRVELQLLQGDHLFISDLGKP